MYTPYGIGFGFQIVNILSTLVFALTLGVVIVGIVRSIRQWSRDEQSPRLTVPAAVVAKRSSRRRTMSNKHHVGRESTNYYVTFQFESGDRMELEMRGTEFGLLVEGDKGMLTFQGARYLGFERIYG